MANTKPLHYDRALTIRADEDFFAALDEARSLIRPVPSKSELIRMAVFELRDRKRASARSQKNSLTTATR